MVQLVSAHESKVQQFSVKLWLSVELGVKAKHVQQNTNDQKATRVVIFEALCMFIM